MTGDATISYTVATTPDGLKVLFDEAAHAYALQETGQVLVPVGTVVKRFKPEFDADLHSARVAAREGKTQEQVKAAWAAKRDAAAGRGKRLHDYIRRSLEASKISPKMVPAPEDDLQAQWQSWWQRSCGAMRPVCVEQVLADPGWGVAGTADAIFQSDKTGKMHVMDWKQNESYATTNLYGRRLLEPFGDLDDCEHALHSLQLSLYRLLLERAKCRQTGDPYVLHVTPTYVEAHRCLDLRSRLARWLDDNKGRL